MLLMLVACLAVCMPAMYVVCVRSGACVVGGSRYKVLPCDACALRPYWCLWPPGSCMGCWGRQAPPERRIYSHLKRSKRREILTKLRSHPRRFVGSSATCGCTNSNLVSARSFSNKVLLNMVNPDERGELGDCHFSFPVGWAREICISQFRRFAFRRPST